MNKEFIIKCWKNPRWHALMVLIIWIVSLSFLIGIFSLIGMLSGTPDNIPVDNNQINYNDKLLKLLNDDYEFIYTININNEIIKYEGTKKDNIITGYRERNDGIIKYVIEGNLVYEVRLDEKNIIDSLYENINTNLIDLNYLYNLINNMDSNVIYEENNLNTHIYNLIIDNIETKVTITESEFYINSILIEEEQLLYKLDFKLLN